MAFTTNTIFRASRPLFRQQAMSSATSAFTRQTVRNATAAPRFAFRSNFYQQGGRRWNSGASAGEQQGWFKRMWESEVGFKTVHFWAPVMKWCLVIAGISDFARPAEKLSFTQNFALTCTGLIWTRWCFVIKPRNVLLAAVNFFLAVVGIVQLTRIGMHEANKKGGAEAVLEEAKEEVKEKVEAVKN